jgi:hypothetical protein
MLINERADIVDLVVDDHVKIFLGRMRLDLGVCKLFRHCVRIRIAVFLLESVAIEESHTISGLDNRQNRERKRQSESDKLGDA